MNPYVATYEMAIFLNHSFSTTGKQIREKRS